jgi:hypothetical protein
VLGPKRHGRAFVDLFPQLAMVNPNFDINCLGHCGRCGPGCNAEAYAHFATAIGRIDSSPALGNVSCIDD